MKRKNGDIMAKLTEALNTSKLELHNRLIMPPMATAKGNEAGYVTDDILNYYEEKSYGGNFGLIITEHCYIDPIGRAKAHQLSIADDSTVESWRKLAEVLHKNNVKAAMQINHAGSVADNGGLELVGPSAIKHLRGQSIPTELTKSQIGNIITKFQLAAGRAKAAGFDAVEIHSAHSYLLNQFYSPLTNHRTDEFGGTLQNRIRIHLEIIDAVRKSVGEGFPILLRLGGCDYMDGGSTINDCVAAAKDFEKAGVDILDLSGGFCGYINPNSSKPGYFSDMSMAVKKEVSIPVILTGGITTALEAEELLKLGAADLIGVGRPVLKDSSWAENAIKHLNQIRM